MRSFHQLYLRPTLLLICGLAAISTVPALPAEEASESLARRIVLGPGDTISIVSLSSEEISKQWRIGESGRLHLPLIGAVDVAGETVAALEAKLNDAYEEYILDPKIDVFVVEIRSRPVTVIGAVEEPGTHQLRGPTSLFQLLQQAGGVTAEASRIFVIRDRQWGLDGLENTRILPDGKAEVQLSLEEVLKGHGRQAQTPIRPFDIVNVEAKRERMVVIAGEVNRPGAILLESRDEVLVSKALALAGGYKRTAASGKSYLWRGDEGPTLLNLKHIVKGKSEDLILRDGDYLIVPPKGGFAMNMQALTTVLGPTSAALVVLGRL